MSAPTPIGREHRWPAGLKARMAFILAVVLIPALLYSCWQAVEAYRDRREQQAAAVSTMLRIIASYEADLFDKTRMLLQRLAIEPAIQRTEQPACTERLIEARNRSPEYFDFVVLDADGTGVCSSARELLGPSSDQGGYFRRLRDGAGFAISDVFPRRTGSGKTIVAAVPLRSPTASGPFSGAVAVSINPQSFQRAVDSIDLPPGGIAFLVDGKGEPLLPLTRERQGVPALPSSELFAELAGQGEGGITAEGADGIRRDYYLAKIAGDDLFVVVGVPSLPRFAWLQRELVIGVFAPTLMLALAVVTIWTASDYLVIRHVRTLGVAARAYSRGELDLRLDLASAPQEFQELARTLARMASRIHRREEELRASLEQKELLLREVHHRVKNNLQIVQSLLNLHAQRLQSPRARDAVRQTQMRVGALVLVHRNLYENDDIQEIDLGSFLPELCSMLEEVNAADHAAVQLSVVAESVRVLADQAIPLALLVTEAVSNAFRHAFRDEQGGHVEVGLAREGERVRLVVADNGSGFAAADDGGGMGITLMHMLAKQLGGSLVVAEATGIRLTLDFPLREGRTQSRSGKIPATGEATAA
ncbi:sensor histidine kinase [Benzoatithermus flavus]|uniref:histidine kinase n=1 Tax=Benzoatithermus flavus TaxID=3108223 RepID=A0ABU8XVN7_9PROT